MGKERKKSRNDASSLFGLNAPFLFGDGALVSAGIAAAVVSVGAVVLIDADDEDDDLKI
jgi:hypothetical protein